MTMEKTYDPKAIEARISALWEESQAFAAGRPDRKDAKPFSIVIPPPNVTGSLHIGHALNNTLQDIICRFERMRGRDVLWQPGTDHAGIATQMVVERQMMERQEPNRHAIGREAFLEKIWAWKEESGGTIVNQLKRLGASCDWSRERFTMGVREDGEAGQMQRAVVEFFVALHEAGLVYKDKRLVNWDPKLMTAISDLEVEQKEVKGSFSFERGQLDKEGHPKPFDETAFGKLLDRNAGGHLYYFDYPIMGEDGEPTGDIITVATTRPETMLGDTGIAVHPENERLKHLIGRKALLPLVGRPIPIVGDDYADPEKGTGAVKITPAHDFNDFDVGKRHGLGVINVFGRDASLSLKANLDFLRDIPHAPSLHALIAELHGQDRFFARKRVVAMMEGQGLLARIEPHAHAVPHGDRSGVPVEPFLTDQWYIDVKPLAERAMKAVEAGETTVLPENRRNDFFRWMENIEPWCVSRQLWWGHRIPAWYGPRLEITDGKRGITLRRGDGAGGFDLDELAFVARSDSEAIALARQSYGAALDDIAIVVAANEDEANRINKDMAQVALWRDGDVLDTWFSSALWPFSTLGWPDETAKLARYYPTNTLVTGFDILFFWVARMMMAGLFTLNKAPFDTVYLHGLVRDEKGRKMSKSVGNVIDPLVVIDELGADALRFTLASMAAQGRDPKLGPKTAEGYRNFCTKLWNAARFAELNGCVRNAGFDPATAKLTLNQWILSELAQTAAAVTMAIEEYRFNEAAAALYRFTWNIFCDWYVELSKPIVQGSEGDEKTETQATTAFVIDETCKLLHPFMPFITEELWAIKGAEGPARDSILCLASWPRYEALEQPEALAEIGWLIALISEIRSARSEMNVPAGSQIPLVLVAASPRNAARAARWLDALKRLARLSRVDFEEAAPRQSVQLVVDGEVAALPLADIIDFKAERDRLLKETSRLAGEIAKVDAKLANADFVARAPEEIIEENRERKAEAELRIARIGDALRQLS